MRTRFDYPFAEDYAHVLSMSWLAYFMATAVAAIVPSADIPRGSQLVLCIVVGTVAAVLLRRPRNAPWLGVLCGACASAVTLLPAFDLQLPMFQFACTFGLITSPVLVIAVLQLRERSPWKGLVVLTGLVLVLSLPLGTEGIWDAWVRGSALIDYESLFIGLPLGSLAASAAWAAARGREQSPPFVSGSLRAMLIGWAVLAVAMGWYGSALGTSGWLFAAGIASVVVLIQRPVLRELGWWRTAGAVLMTFVLVVVLQAVSQWAFLSITAA